MKCDFCGYDGYESGKDYGGYGNAPHNVKLYKHYKMNLCDRCVDKINSYHNGEDVDTYWEDEDAINSGFKPFPDKEIPNYIADCIGDLEYIHRKFSELYKIEAEYYHTPSIWEHRKHDVESNIRTIKSVIEKIEKKYSERI